MKDYLRILPGEIPQTPAFTAALKVAEVLKHENFEVFFVGGCVRDIVMEREPKDYDLVTSATPDQIIALFPHTVTVGAAFGVVVVVTEEGFQVEVATYRKDGMYKDGRHPDSVEYSDSAIEDVYRRDFTMNGLIFDPFPNGGIFDYVGGLQDIRDGIIRTIGDADTRFGEDYLRMLRAIRFSAQLNMFPLDETYDAIKKSAYNIAEVSSERVRDEVIKILVSPRPYKGIYFLNLTGLLPHILPEVSALIGCKQSPIHHPEGDVWAHTLTMLDSAPGVVLKGWNEEDIAVFMWSVLLHDIGKPATWSEDEKGIHNYGHEKVGARIATEILERLKFPTNFIKRVSNIVRNHMKFHWAQKLRKSKLYSLLSSPDIELMLELHFLDELSTGPSAMTNYYYCKSFLDKVPVQTLNPKTLLNGDDLIEQGFTPGPLFSVILKDVRSNQIEGTLVTKEDAIAYVRGEDFA